MRGRVSNGIRYISGQPRHGACSRLQRMSHRFQPVSLCSFAACSPINCCQEAQLTTSAGKKHCDEFSNTHNNHNMRKCTHQHTLSCHVLNDYRQHNDLATPGWIVQSAQTVDTLFVHAAVTHIGAVNAHVNTRHKKCAHANTASSLGQCIELLV